MNRALAAAHGKPDIRTAEEIVTRREDPTTNAPFSKEEIALIRQAIVTPGATVECPRCGTLLTPEGPIAVDAAEGDVLWLCCATCKRNLIVRDLPDEHRAS